MAPQISLPGSFPSAFLQQLLHKLDSQELIDFVPEQVAWLKKLKKTISTIDKVVNEAEEKQFRNLEMNDWLAQLTDVCYDLEDLLDQIATEALRSKLDSQSWGSVFAHSHDVEQRIEKITISMEDLEGQKDRLGLKEASVKARTQIQPQPSSLVDENCQVFGRDEDLEAIIKLLLPDDHVAADERDVIAIVGEGGVGKTTLAELVYMDERVKNHFDLKMWVCVPEVFYANRVIKAILKQLIAFQPSDIEDLSDLHARLKESLNTKKFLLVLDNFWCNKYSDWEILRSVLANGSTGSKIVVTTRSLDLAAVMATLPAYHLKPLPNEDSWMLFAKHAFDENKKSSLNPELETIGKELLKKCKGLPLAAKLMGAFMRFKPTVEEWLTVLKNNIFDFSYDRSCIFQVLMLSYYYLPAHLKRCFAYCSMFPNNYEYEEEKLIRLWMAEGFLEESRQQRMEEVAHEYFVDLISRSFFQRSNINKSHFIMHDLVRDVALIASRDYISRLPHLDFFSRLVNTCYFSCLTTFENLELSWNKVRHLSFCGGNFSEIVEEISKTEILRTLLPYEFPAENEPCHISDELLEIMMENQYCLRVLSLSHQQIIVLPDSVGELELLRYLDLSHTAINTLPSSVNALYNLQTLLLSNCHSLTELPTNMGNLVKLCHLDVHETDLNKMPADIGRLTSLQKLSNFIVGTYGNSGIKELGCLSNLRGRLHISQLQNVAVARDAFEGRLQDKKELGALELEWSGGATAGSENEREVLELLQPHQHLKELSIKRYNGTEFPAWLGDSSFINMVLLQLTECNNCLHLPPLGQLPSLKYLIIEEMKQIKRVGPEFGGTINSSDGPFPSLETLTFEGMLEWEEWIPTDFEGKEFLFPNLRELHIRRCPKLKRSLPKSLPPTTRVEISACPELVVTLLGHPVVDDLKLFDSNMMPPRSVDEAAVSQRSEHKTDAQQQDISDFVSLRVSELEQLMKLPPRRLHSLKIEGAVALKLIPGELMHSNPNLLHLYIIDCCSLQSFVGNLLPVSLKTLYIRNCRRLDFLSFADSMQQYSRLEHLCIGSSCDSLGSIPLALFPKLRTLVVWDCANFDSISIEKDHMSLDALEIRDCPNLEYFPEEGLLTPNLKSVLLSNCRSLRVLPGNLHRLTSLQSLFVNECPELMSVPERGFPINLDSLCIISCHKLTPSSEWGLHKLDKLIRLEIEGGCGDLESFPKQELLPNNLSSLRISRLLKLKFLDYKGLQHLTSLKKLEINLCNKLQSFPEEGLPSSVSYLYIKDCSLLKPKLQNKKGKYWYKIAYIPHIEVDDEVIS